MNRVLVISYSRSGTTSRLASRIAADLSADRCEIIDVRPRDGLVGYMQSALESVAKGLPSIRVDVDPAAYELVVAGTPVWAGSMASPMRSFLTRHAGRIRRLACFCTMGGRGGAETLHEMQAIVGETRALMFSVTAGELQSGHRDQELLEFIYDLQDLALPKVAAV